MPSLKTLEVSKEEKVGFFDIEASNLKASFGIVFSYCIKEANGKIIGRCIRPEELKDRNVLDKKVLEQLCTDLRKFDRIVTFYGTNFDIPFIRTRSLFYKLDFPVYKEINHTDLYYMVKSRLNLHRKSLETCCDFFGIPSKGHRLKPDVWFGAHSGNTKDLNYIYEHNKEDVISTELLFNKMKPFCMSTRRSI